ncbi:MAG TPA: PQQ-binding-like beta-propeller repeat protein [Acidimicrobiales bacterium]
MPTQVGTQKIHRSRAALARLGMGLLAGALTTGLGVVATSAPPSGSSTPNAAVPGPLGNQVWSVSVPDGAGTILQSSPNVATLPVPGGLVPAVTVGDQGGTVYAYSLSAGAPIWSYPAGAPVQSSPSEGTTTAGNAADTTFIGVGTAADPQPASPGYQAINPQGSRQWATPETDPATNSSKQYGVGASLAVGNLQGGTDVTAPSLSQNQEALNGATGAILSGFPWFQADTSFSTPALADMYEGGNGPTDIVEGGGSTAAANVYGQQYFNGGIVRVLSPNGNAGQAEPNQGYACQTPTNVGINSSPAVGEFLGANQVGFAVGTGGSPAPGAPASASNEVLAFDNHCNLKWTATLNGATPGGPALADVLGNGALQVIEGTAGGMVYALDGASGNVDWSTPVSGSVYGSPATVDTGNGHQDVVVATTSGVYLLDGKTGAIQGSQQLTTFSFQNTPLITDDPNGTIGITLAGIPDAGGGSEIFHYELPASNGSVVNEAGAWPQFHHDAQLTGDAGTNVSIQVPCNAPRTAPTGYDLSASDGGVFTFGNLPFCGSTGAITLNKPMVGMALTKDAGGYWEVASDGGIFAFGDAQFYGSTGGIHLNQPIVGMAPTPDGGGYWLVASDGGIFAFGDAKFFGSTGAVHLNKPIVGMTPTPTGKGYWLVASDGGIFAFGDANFFGSTGAIHLNQPIVGMASTSTGGGYWLVAADGGIFTFGNANFYGSTGAIHLNKPIVGMAATPSGQGYWLVASDGGIFTFGDGVFYGSTGGIHLNKPIVGMAAVS